MSSTTKSRQLLKAEHKQLQQDIDNYITALEQEQDPELKDTTKRNLERFLGRFHSSNWAIKNLLYKVMKGSAEGAAANRELSHLWRKYRIASENLEAARNNATHSNAPYAFTHLTFIMFNEIHQHSPTAPMNMYPSTGADPYQMQLAQASQSGSLSDPMVAMRPYGPYTSMGRDHRSSVASASSSENYGYRELARPQGSGASTSQMEGNQYSNPQYGAAQPMPMQQVQQFYASYPPTQQPNPGAGQVYSYNAQWPNQQPLNGGYMF
ncbi:hypothetical protein C8R46DRAFT_1353314 [Mycena filopes]|nr:hypothetical protein C8R46DRAFT_1353314 [Mycena filopes]